MSGYENDFIDAAVAEYNPSIDVDYDFRERSFMENVITSTKLQPLWQSLNAAEGYHEEYKGDDWKPLMPNNTEGYENFAWRLAKARNPDHEQLMKDQIDENQMLRQEEAQHGSWQGMLFSEVLNPVNYLPIPGVAGAGFFKGAVKMTAYNLPLIAGEEALRQYVDPTTEGSEFGVNVFYTSVFSAGIGGLSGKFLKTPDIGGWLDVKGKENDMQAKATDSIYEPENLKTPAESVVNEPGVKTTDPEFNLGGERTALEPDDFDAAKMIEDEKLFKWSRAHEAMYQFLRNSTGWADEGRHTMLKRIEENPQYGNIEWAFERLTEMLPVRVDPKGNPKAGIALDEGDIDSRGVWLAMEKIIRLSTTLNSEEMLGTINHEVIHGLRNLDVFTKAEWDLLRVRSSSNWIDRYKLRADYTKRYAKKFEGDPEGLERALEEEGIAQAFMEWSKNRRTREIDAKTKGIFEAWAKKLKGVVKDLRSKFDKKVGLGKAPEDINEIFERIRRGDMKNRAEMYGVGEREFGDVAPAQLKDGVPVDPGAKKVWGGFHNVVQISTMGTLVQSGSRAISDLALKMAGDFGFMLERNSSGEATPQSAFLRAGIWDGMAIDTVRQADESFVRYLTDGATGGTKFGSVNVAAAAEKMKNMAGKSTNDKMSYPEFMTEVSKAFKAEKLEHADPYVLEAATAIDTFMKKAGDEGYKSGLIPSRGGYLRLADRNTAKIADIQNKLADIEANPGPHDELKKRYLKSQEQRLIRQQEGMHLMGLDAYDIQRTIEEIMDFADRRAESAQHKIDDIESDLDYKAYMDMKVLQEFLSKPYLTEKQGKYFDYLAKKYADYLPLLGDRTLNLDEIFEAFADDIKIEGATPKQKKYLDLLRKHTNKELSVRQEAYLKDLQDTFGTYLNSGLPEQKGPYLPMVYDLQRIANDYELGENSVFLAKVMDKFTQNELAKGYTPNPAMIRKQAEEWITGSILKRAEDADDVGFDTNAASMNGMFRWMRRRTIGFTHDEVADFVETDATRIVRDYTRAFGIGNEFAKMFGNRTADDSISETIVAAIDELGPDIGADQAAKMIDKHAEDLRRLADMTNGDRNRRHPLTWDKYSADALRSWASATMLGRVIKTVVPEVAHIAMVNGLKKTMGFAFKALAQDMDQYRHIIKDLKPHTIEGWDMASAEAAQRMIGNLEGHGPAESATLNKIAQSKASQRWFNFAGGNLYNFNLLAPATEAMKTFQMVMSSHRFIDDIMSGANPDRLASHGFAPDSIAKIQAMVENGTIGKSHEDGMWHANVSAWPDGELRAVYMSAVSGEIRRVVATAGPGDMRDAFAGYWGKPGSQTRFALGALPFQFMQFSIAATTKYTLSAAQGRDASPVIGLAMLVGMGYLSTWLKTPDWAWDKMTYDERLLRAVEGSGALALFGDMPAMLEQATANQYGIRPLLGLDAKFPIDSKLDQASLLWGPGGDKIADLYKMIISPDTDNRDRARYLRRSVPLNDLVYWHSFFLDADPIVEQGFEQIY